MTRKIDKRACRKFAIPELEFNLNEGILHVERCPYIIRTAVHNISGQRILVLYIYQSENILAGSIKPRWVMFHSRDDFATLSFRENAKATWQCSTLDSLDRIGGFDSKCAFYRQQDEARVARFCKCECGAISVLGYLQRLISRHRELERKWKKQRAIIERMKYVPALPRDLKGFIHREVMPQYIFYDYQRKGPEHAFCTACRHEVSILAAKHNTSGICPRCKKKITFKSRGKRGRVFDRATVQVLQKAEVNGLVLRIIKVYRAFVDSDIPNHFETWENARQFITLSSSGQCSIDAYYYHHKAEYDLTPWCYGYRPVLYPWQDNFTADMNGILYLCNLSDTLKDTPWAYSQLEIFSGIASFSGVATFLSAYIKRPKIEHLIKMKLYRLVSGIIYGGYSYSALQAINFNGENMRAILGIDRPYFPLLRELDPSIDQLHLIRQLLQADHKPSTEQIKWFIANRISNADAAKELLAHMSVHKLQRYAERQFTPEDEAALKRVDHYKMNTLITDYHDYRQMFFYKDGTLYQSRLYPADTGNALEVSKLFRHLVQKAISRCLMEPNLWYLKTKRSDLDAHYSTRRGSLHYPDYDFHGNLSILQGHKKDTVLPIGAAALCVCCGNELWSNGDIKCSCKEVVVCRKCGQTVARGQGIYLEDGFYCKTCLHICEACGRPTLGTMYPAYDRRGSLLQICHDCYQQLTASCSSCSMAAACRTMGFTICKKATIPVAA